MKSIVILDKAGIEAVITKLGKNTLDADVQAALLGCAKHASDHGDITLLNRLYAAVPRGTRKSAFTAWVLAFAMVEANADAATKKDAPFKYAKDKASFADVQAEAMANPWYDFSPDKAPDEVFDAIKALKALIAKSAKSKTVVGEDLLTQLKALAATVGAAE